MIELAAPLAVIACCFAGAMGGYTLALPGEALARNSLAPVGDGHDGFARARAFGGLLLTSHAVTAWLLGYTPPLGAQMALALALAWAGSAIGRVVSLLRDGPGGAQGVQALVFEVLMSVTLALPQWTGQNSLVAGPTITV